MTSLLKAILPSGNKHSELQRIHELVREVPRIRMPSRRPRFGLMTKRILGSRLQQVQFVNLLKQIIQLVNFVC